MSGKRLDVFCAEEIFGPLKMKDTEFNPPTAKHHRIAPTTGTGPDALRGTVHDPRARKTAGIAGHAGLFSTAPDLARYARMLLNGGSLDSTMLFSPATIKLMTSVQTPPTLNARRGLGWDIDTGAARWPPRRAVFRSAPAATPASPARQCGSIRFRNIRHLPVQSRASDREGPSVVPLRRSIGSLAVEAVKNSISPMCPAP